MPPSISATHAVRTCLAASKVNAPRWFQSVKLVVHWGEALLGAGAFGEADRSKWLFLENGPAGAGRNPAWERDELILALDLYFQLGRRVPDESDAAVVALSELLNELPIHSERPDRERFRNPNGVALKLANFRALDQPGHGMSRFGKRDREVWAEFAGDADILHRVAEAIRGGYTSPDAAPTHVAMEEEEETSFPEGRVIYRLHRARERNRTLVARKKAEAGRPLSCEACGFDFAAVYGAVGDGYIECHHAMPLSQVTARMTTRLADLVLVCSNCHRMIHRKRPWLSVSEIRHFINRQ